jgi:glycosyltransferase involved in cell wall biosynthesis
VHIPLDPRARKRVLLIAYHFPPVRGSSGVQRTLRFAQHLPKFGWDPVVLTIVPGAYAESGDSPGNEVPPGVPVHRAFGLDAGRQLKFAGIYPHFLAVPDRWRTWQYFAIPKGRQLLQSASIDAIWSTFPIATAHRIGLELARWSGLPWVAEFRDPMWQGAYPPNPAINRAFRQLEAEVVDRASAVVLTTPSAVRQYQERFGPQCSGKIQMIENGFDEEVFARAESLVRHGPPAARDQPVVLLHSGVVYRSERDPTALFDALARLKRAGVLSSRRVRVVLRASGSENEYRTMLRDRSIDDIVELAPPLDYMSALQEMLTADALLVMQASNCNAQVPAKLYEYLRAGRPLLALTDPAGDTAGVLQRAGAGTIARLDSVDSIASVLPAFLEQLEQNRGRPARVDNVQGFSREMQAGQLAGLLTAVCGSRGSHP